MTYYILCIIWYMLYVMCYVLCVICHMRYAMLYAICYMCVVCYVLYVMCYMMMLYVICYRLYVIYLLPITYYILPDNHFYTNTLGWMFNVLHCLSCWIVIWNFNRIKFSGRLFWLCDPVYKILFCPGKVFIYLQIFSTWFVYFILYILENILWYKPISEFPFKCLFFFYAFTYAHISL